MRELKNCLKWVYSGLKSYDFKILSVVAVIVWILGFYLLLHGVGHASTTQCYTDNYGNTSCYNYDTGKTTQCYTDNYGNTSCYTN